MVSQNISQATDTAGEPFPLLDNRLIRTLESVDRLSLHCCCLRSNANWRSIFQDSTDPDSTRRPFHLYGPVFFRNHVCPLLSCNAYVLQRYGDRGRLDGAICQLGERPCGLAEGVLRRTDLLLVDFVVCQVELAVHVQEID